MKRFMLINHGGESLSFSTYTPEQIRQYLDRWRIWISTLAGKGNFDSAEPLLPRKVIYKKDEQEAELAVDELSATGYCIIKAIDWDEALAIAKYCPVIEEGETCEIREIGR